MPGRDKAGLDGSAWKNLNPLTAVAQRRETTTGVDARNRSTYSQVTATKPEKKTIPADFGVLTALPQAGEETREPFIKSGQLYAIIRKKKNGEGRKRNDGEP